MRTTFSTSIVGDKRAASDLVGKMVIQLLFALFVFAMFFSYASYKVNSKTVNQQILDKQLSLFVDSAEKGTEMWISKQQEKFYVSKIEVKDGRIFSFVEGIGFSRGYPYISKYNLNVQDSGDKLILRVGE